MKHSSPHHLVVPALLCLGSALSAQTVTGQQPIGPPTKIPHPTGPEVASDRLYTSASALTNAVHAPGDPTRLYLVEQRGVIQVFDLNTNTVTGTFLDINSRVIDGLGERGLLGVAFHPDFATNGLFYVNYSRNGDGDTVVAEYTSTSADVGNFDPERILMTINQPQSNHNGGWIGFSPNDEYLYIATGDGGNFCDTGSGHTSGIGNAQDVTTNLLGKMLRIDPIGTPYTVPADNPFVGIEGDDEIWSYGLRNPWRASFDRLTGDLYIGDVGQDNKEEVDWQPGDSIGGENYGWRCREGTVCATGGASSCVATTGCTCPGSMPSLTAPVHDYGHAGVCSVIGGYAYRGSVFPHLGGHYFFADHCSANIWSFRIANGVKGDFRTWTSRLSPSLDGFNISSIRSFGEDANGELYICASGSLFKIVPEP